MVAENGKTSHEGYSSKTYSPFNVYIREQASLMREKSFHDKTNLLIGMGFELKSGEVFEALHGYETPKECFDAFQFLTGRGFKLFILEKKLSEGTSVLQEISRADLEKML